ncbi:MAG TPA: helix-turn-helix transcriptional regulator [Solirubrobacteraceae bacterium]|jgi:PadR family transcriptional regulator PadR
MVSLTPHTQAVLAALLRDADEPQYGLEIAKTAGLASGTLYPILARLERQRWVESEWEQIDESTEGRRRRRYYRLTGEGARAARAELEATAERLRTALEPVPRSASTRIGFGVRAADGGFA